MFHPKAGHDLIVIGASAGGIEAVRELLRLLPADLPAVVCVVQHTAPTSPGTLPQILQRDTHMKVAAAIDGSPLELGRVYVAPPDRHLLIEPGRMRVVRGPRENLNRPSIDPLFRSAALAYGRRVVGVVLTGMLSDGAAGLRAIKQQGGVALVQDPDEAQFPSMPNSALAQVDVDQCLPLAELGRSLIALAGEDEDGSAVPPAGAALRDETRMALGGHNDPQALDRLGRPTPFTCPECHGTLWELDEGEYLRYRCHTGHALTADALQAGQADNRERALGVALRTLEEQAALFKRMAQRARDQENLFSADRFELRAQDHRRDADLIRSILINAPVQVAADAPATGNIP